MPVEQSQNKVTLKHGKSTVQIYLLGATLTSWVFDGQERIFVSPLVFPQFGPKGPLPQHGFARVSKWDWLGVTTENASELTVSFGLKPDAVPESQRKIWSHDFKLLYTVTLIGNTLKTKLTVHNTSSGPFGFTSLLHTYIRVKDVTKAQVVGLTGYTLEDTINNNLISTESRHGVTVAGEVDRVYQNVTNNILTIENTHIGAGFIISKSNFKDVVVWNPWIENAKKMADFDDEEYLNMICVEVGNVASPIQLAPGGVWEGEQTLVAI
ncbi:hypothetical protein HK103_003746 [Boothiomyces macroporosus]|uniref:Glucose-6-phosphate 1-epimerase n=1 Tax=Boothiomyces macroporosus TaxID=261099 RepID=A0AAD5Y8V9_9FUNG|nr:hypothetical protein HK103_003746 [Boothiomyces macroporosus]